MPDNPRIYGYKIRNTATGLYLTGGSSLKESRIGKVWHTRASAINSINLKISASNSRQMVCSYQEAYKVGVSDYRESVLNFEIVELKESGSYSISFFLDKLDI